MKKQWKIQTRLLVTFVALICITLFIVVLTFNILINSYVRSRVSMQLSSLIKNGEHARKDQKDGKGGRGSFDEKPDRVIGTRGSAVLLDADGELLLVLHGEQEVAEELSEYFISHGGIMGEMQAKNVSLADRKYCISIVSDEEKEDAYYVYYVDITSITAFIDRVNRMLILITIIAVLLSALLSRHLAKSVAKPLRELSDFASDIGGGKFEQRNLSFQDAEFICLADSMNHMAEELKQANVKQETFFQNVSHELRTPLTSIRGNAEGIVYGVMEPESSGKTILKETDRLSGLIEDLLYLSRAGKNMGEVQELDLRENIVFCASEQEAEAGIRGITFVYEFEEAPVVYAMRERDATEIFSNLIANALRYAKSEVKLSCKKEADRILISVSDDGNGIQENDLPHIFERFYKGSDGKHGIGLAIVKAAVEAYQGLVIARNENGMVFEITFPINTLPMKQ